jgi:hypothetical protein
MEHSRFPADRGNLIFWPPDNTEETTNDVWRADLLARSSSGYQLSRIQQARSPGVAQDGGRVESVILH